MSDWKTSPEYLARRDEARLKWLDKYLNDDDSTAESPIEALLRDALRLMPIPARAYIPAPKSLPGTMIFFPGTDIPDWRKDYLPQFNSYVFGLEQITIDKYRPDFGIFAKFDGNFHRIAIECDGHGFHERTPEQAERDRSRDRWFVSQDFTVIRFTGREIWRDPFACTAEVSALLQQWADRDFAP